MRKRLLAALAVLATCALMAVPVAAWALDSPADSHQLSAAPESVVATQATPEVITLATGSITPLADILVSDDDWWSLESSDTDVFTIEEVEVGGGASSDEDDDDYGYGSDYVYAIHAWAPGVATLYSEYGYIDDVVIVVKAATITRVGAATQDIGLFQSRQFSVGSDISNPGVDWSSSKTSVATVDSKGVVTAEGAGAATITAKSPYGNSVSWTVKVGKARGSKVKIAKIANQAYSGKAKKPKIVATLHGKALVAGRDYTVKYSHNKSIGTAKATVKFKGSFTGKQVKKFKIVAPKVGKPKITYWFSGSYYSRIEWSGGKNSTGTQLSITGGGTSPYSKHIKGSWGYGSCRKGVKDSTATFSIRSYKTVHGKRFYSGWVKKRL